MPKRSHSSHARRALSIVGDDPPPDVRIDGVGTVPMTDEQYAAAVHALAVLIENWRPNKTSTSADDAEFPLAA